MELDPTLARFNPSTPTHKVVRELVQVIPGGPPFHPYSSLAEAVRTVSPAASSRVKAAAHAVVKQAQYQKALRVADLIDKGDGAYAAVTGVRKTVGYFMRDRNVEELDVDEQQRNDAVLKAIALAWMVHTLFQGNAREKAAAFWELPAGRALGLYYGAVEVALPFADNAAQKGKETLDTLFSGRGGPQMRRAAKLLPGLNTGQTREMLGALQDKLGDQVDVGRRYAKAYATRAKGVMPKIARTADTATGVVATAADLLPVYRMLGARLVAEAAASEAVRRAGKLG